MKIKLMYHGERLQFGYGKPQQLFKSKDGKEYFWTGVKHVWFGSVYEAEKKADGHLSIQLNPKEVSPPPWEPTEDERIKYEAAKMAVLGYRQSRRKEMQLKRPHKDLSRAVDLFRPFYLGLSKLDRRRLVEWFENECSKKQLAKGKRAR